MCVIVESLKTAFEFGEPRDSFIEFIALLSDIIVSGCSINPVD